MRRLPVPLWFLLGALAVAASLMVYHYPLMPDRMATHFGPDGRADGWMSKDGFFAFFAGMLAFQGALFAGLAYALPKLPPETINLPNKEFWLAPERLAGTAAFIREHMLWIGAATVALMVSLLQLTFRANLTPEPRLGNLFFVILLAYLAYLAVWMTALFRRFRLPSA